MASTKYDIANLEKKIDRIESAMSRINEELNRRKRKKPADKKPDAKKQPAAKKPKKLTKAELEEENKKLKNKLKREQTKAKA